MNLLQLFNYLNLGISSDKSRKASHISYSSKNLSYLLKGFPLEDSAGDSADFQGGDDLKVQGYSIEPDRVVFKVRGAVHLSSEVKFNDLESATFDIIKSKDNNEKLLNDYEQVVKSLASTSESDRVAGIRVIDFIRDVIEKNDMTEYVPLYINCIAVGDDIKEVNIKISDVDWGIDYSNNKLLLFTELPIHQVSDQTYNYFRFVLDVKSEV